MLCGKGLFRAIDGGGLTSVIQARIEAAVKVAKSYQVRAPGENVLDANWLDESRAAREPITLHANVCDTLTAQVLSNG